MNQNALKDAYGTFHKLLFESHSLSGGVQDYT